MKLRRFVSIRPKAGVFYDTFDGSRRWMWGSEIFVGTAGSRLWHLIARHARGVTGDWRQETSDRRLDTGECATKPLACDDPQRALGSSWFNLVHLGSSRSASHSPRISLPSSCSISLCLGAETRTTQRSARTAIATPGRRRGAGGLAARRRGLACSRARCLRRLRGLARGARRGCQGGHAARRGDRALCRRPRGWG